MSPIEDQIFLPEKQSENLALKQSENLALINRSNNINIYSIEKKEKKDPEFLILENLEVENTDKREAEKLNVNPPVIDQNSAELTKKSTLLLFNIC